MPDLTIEELLEEASSCPWCGSEKWDCEYVDVGVGSIPCSPLSCYDCHAYQIDWRLTKEDLEELYSDLERKMGVARGEGSPEVPVRCPLPEGCWDYRNTTARAKLREEKSKSYMGYQTL